MSIKNDRNHLFNELGMHTGQVDPNQPQEKAQRPNINPAQKKRPLRKPPPPPPRSQKPARPQAAVAKANLPYPIDDRALDRLLPEDSSRMTPLNPDLKQTFNNQAPKVAKANLPYPIDDRALDRLLPEDSSQMTPLNPGFKQTFNDQAPKVAKANLPYPIDDRALDRLLPEDSSPMTPLNPGFKQTFNDQAPKVAKANLPYPIDDRALNRLLPEDSSRMTPLNPGLKQAFNNQDPKVAIAPYPVSFGLLSSIDLSSQRQPSAPQNTGVSLKRRNAISSIKMHSGVKVSEPRLTNIQKSTLKLLSTQIKSEVYIQQIPMNNSESLLMIPTKIQGGFGQLFIGIKPNGEIQAVKKTRRMKTMEVERNRDGSIKKATALYRHLEIIEASKTKQFAPSLKLHDIIFPENDKDFTYTPMKLMKGDCLSLYNYHHNNPEKMRELNRLVLKEISTQVGNMHKQNAIHADLKMENVLFSHDGTLQISDYGMTISTNTKVKSPVRGTYISPEQLSNHYKQWGNAIDVWSLGISLMRSNAPSSAYKQGHMAHWPFRHPLHLGDPVTSQQASEIYAADYFSGNMMREAHVQGSPTFNFHQMDPELCEFVLGRMLHPSPSERATMDEVVSFLEDMQNRESQAQVHHAPSNLSQFTAPVNENSDIKFIKAALYRITGQTPKATE